jgi:hypothetical protein
MYTYVTADELRSFPLRDLARLASLTPTQAAEALGRTPRTLRRWQESITPRWAVDYLLYRVGILGAVHLDWDGWRIRDGELWTPSGWHTTPGEILSLPYLYSLAEYHRHQQPEQIPLTLVRP